jgi:starch-binding outer membrane protein, SusD/RagB family
MRATTTTRRLRAATLALGLAGAGGCRTEDLTETPQNFVTIDNYYATPADVTGATLAAYAPLFQQAWGRWMPLLGDLPSDQTRIHPDEPNIQTYAPGLLQWSPTSDATVSVWNGLFATIYRANVAMERTARVQFPKAADQAALIAEAKFLRGFAYLQLTKGWGDVPLLLSTADHAAAVGKGRNPTDEVHAAILKDFTDAEAGLPALPEAHGRASKAAAQMALADLHQWRSSFLGKPEWAQVAAATKRVMESGNWALTNDYLAPFLPANKGYPANREVIWMTPASGVDGRTSTDAFCLWLPRELGFGSAGGCEIIGQPTRWMLDSWAPGDYRKEVTYRTEGCSTNATIGCVTFKWPNVYKYRPTNRGIGGPVDVDHPLYRYAETLLMHAEAQFELGNPAEALRLVNLVRARARRGTGSESRAQPADLTAISREAIYMERNWELAHEGKRWFDLLRRNVQEPGYLVAQLDAHDPETRARGDLSPFRLRWPIPQNEINTNPALKQNPGY